MWAQILAANAVAVADVLAAVSTDLATAAEALRDAAADGAGLGLKAVTGLLDEGTAGVTRIPGKHSKPRRDDTVVQVVIPDVPGELARLFRAAGDAGVNIEDIGIEHSPGLPVGVAELVVRPEAVARLTQALAASGWPVRR
jgi:prephenate dehydrogenase